MAATFTANAASGTSAQRHRRQASRSTAHAPATTAYCTRKWAKRSKRHQSWPRKPAKVAAAQPIAPTSAAGRQTLATTVRHREVPDVTR